MSATEKVNQYRISSNFESSGILGIFTKIEGRKWSIRNNSKEKNIYFPTEVLSRWKSLFNQKQS